jgi:hypothetical protein
MLNGNVSLPRALFPRLAMAYDQEFNKQWWRPYGYGTGKGCCWQSPDAMEVSISGSGCRPTIASAMWGEATAAAKMARLLGGANASAQVRRGVRGAAQHSIELRPLSVLPVGRGRWRTSAPRPRRQKR